MSSIEPDSPKRAGLNLSPKLTARIRTALIIGIPTLVAIFATSPIPLGLILLAVAIFASIELNRLIDLPHAWISTVSIAIFLTVSFNIHPVAPIPITAGIALTLGIFSMINRSLSQKTSPLDFLTLGWIAGPIACAFWIHQTTADPTRLFSPNVLILMLMPLWIGDTAAYFAGKHFGKRPLAPKISPNKTWEGAIANLVFCAITAVIIAAIIAQPLYLGAIVGVTIGIFGQAGDLLQSALKRSTNSKDSGDILPGHGGVLDRLDSFFLASVPVATIIYILLPELFHVKQ